MGIENLRLNPLTIGFLYEKDLVLISKKGLHEKTTEKQYLGLNRQKISIIVAEKDSVFIKENDLEILVRMLNACKMTLEDVAIVNTMHQPINWNNIKNITQPAKLLFFGVGSSEFGMPIRFPEYHIQQYDGLQCLISDSLENISRNQLLKSKLWICLQNLFLS
jgi:hypothetical protein